MKKLFYSLTVGCLAVLTVSCQSTQTSVQTPAVEAPQPMKHALDVIGGIEPVYVLPMKASFDARIDTGAETSSLGASRIRPFERDGEKWVSFDLVNSSTGEKKHFEKRVERKARIRRSTADEFRMTVMMDVKIGTEVISTEFTLADRDNFNYQLLIGRNIINGRFIVDPSIENTLH